MILLLTVRREDALNAGNLPAVPVQAADIGFGVEVPDIALAVLRCADDVLARGVVPSEDGAAREGGEDRGRVGRSLE